MPCNATTNQDDQWTHLPPLQDRQNPETEMRAGDEMPRMPSDETSPQGEKGLDLLSSLSWFPTSLWLSAPQPQRTIYHLFNTRRRRAGRISCASVDLICRGPPCCADDTSGWILNDHALGRHMPLRLLFLCVRPSPLEHSETPERQHCLLAVSRSGLVIGIFGRGWRHPWASMDKIRHIGQTLGSSLATQGWQIFASGTGARRGDWEGKGLPDAGDERRDGWRARKVITGQARLSTRWSSCNPAGQAGEAAFS